VAHERADNAAANQKTALARDQVNINVRAWQQPHLSFRHQSHIGNIGDRELTAGAKPHLR
jgi:hypothetical protein